jgi:hypothetical protein
VLEVVEHEEQAPIAKSDHQAIVQRLYADVAQPEAPRDGGQDEVGVADRGEVDEDDPIGEVGRDLGGNGDRQPRLADAAGAGQGQQADGGIAHQGDDGGHFPIPGDQRRQRPREGSAASVHEGTDN